VAATIPIVEVVVGAATVAKKRRVVVGRHHRDHSSIRVADVCWCVLVGAAAKKAAAAAAAATPDLASELLLRPVVGDGVETTTKENPLQTWHPSCYCGQLLEQKHLVVVVATAAVVVIVVIVPNGMWRKTGKAGAPSFLGRRHCSA
jgi:hypothetical protein